MSRCATTVDLPRDDYLDLVRRLPLRPIRNDGELEAAHEMLREHMRRTEGELTDGENDYLGTLATLVHRYETAAHPVPPDGRSPRQRLQFLIEESEIPAVDLEELLGGPVATASYLSGSRDLFAADVRRLVDHYHLDPSYFL